METSCWVRTCYFNPSSSQGIRDHPLHIADAEAVMLLGTQDVTIFKRGRKWKSEFARRVKEEANGPWGAEEPQLPPQQLAAFSTYPLTHFSTCFPRTVGGPRLHSKAASRRKRTVQSPVTLLSWDSGHFHSINCWWRPGNEAGQAVPCLGTCWVSVLVVSPHLCVEELNIHHFTEHRTNRQHTAVTEEFTDPSYSQMQAFHFLINMQSHQPLSLGIVFLDIQDSALDIPNQNLQALG
jgi:hypothetical protein